MFTSIRFTASWIILLLSTTVVLCAAESDSRRGYYRWPTAHGDHVVFTADGDLWKAPLAGGEARRLTSAKGEERFAMFSPDGKWIAFSGNYDGNTDVYVMRSGGGEPRRLTYHPGRDWVAAWTPDGKVVFRSYANTGQRTYECFTISPEGGYAEKSPVDKAAHITFEPDGDRIAYTRFSLGFRTWKRYKGGWAEDIFVGSTRTHDYREVTQNRGNDATPMWYGDRIYYVRDNDARANIHSMKPDGSDIQQHTFFKEWDVRWSSLADGKIAFSLGADIWVYDLTSNEAHMVDVTLPSERLRARDRFVTPDNYLDYYDLSPDGTRLLLAARGEIFSASTERKSIIHRLSWTEGAREHWPNYTPDGKHVICWSDMDGGEEALYRFPADGKGEPEKIADGPGEMNFDIRISPDGKYAVSGDNHRRLNLMNLESGGITEIDASLWEIRGYQWSPDSRYVAYTAKSDNELDAIRVYDVEKKEVHAVTDPMWASFSPTWDPKGKWLYFLSGRFQNAYRGFNDFNFVTMDTEQIFGLALTKDTKSPYAYKDESIESEDDEDDEEDENGDKNDEEKDDDDEDDEEDEKEVEPIEIDWDGLENRIVRFPIDPGNYSQLSAIKGKLYLISRKTGGYMTSRIHEKARTSLLLFEIKKKKTHNVIKGARSYELSHDNKKIVVSKKKAFVIMDAGDTKAPEPDEDDPDAGLHLDEWVFDIDPLSEWKQIYHEAWKYQRDFFYDPNMHGIDWQAMGDQYGSLINRIGTRDELNDIIAQLFGELNVGHAYIFGGDRERAKSVGVGLLGIDVTRHASGFYRIEKILEGDIWDEKRSSPLAAPGMNVEPGEFLVAIDQRPVDEVENYLQLLNNKSGKLVIVSVNDKPSLEGARELVVKTLSGERGPRYWDWVYGRIDYIQDRAGEAAKDIGYIHLSNMGGSGMEQWMREYYPQSQNKALIIDVRYNGGGNIAQWILSELERTVWHWGMARNGYRDKGPGTAFQGHLICLCNEETGSDGETFSEGFKRLDLGPLVGKRTWGGWVGIRGGKPFVDHGGSTQPEFTGWGADRKWLIEGPGVDPDVEVDNHPKMVMEGHDEQLDYAIEYLKRKLIEEPIEWPAMPEFPNKAPTGN